jgi:predicted oxidoreductase
MEIYRIPRREVTVRILVDDGRTIDGTLFTAETGAAGRPEDALQHLNATDEDFVPLACGADRFLLNKAGIIWAQVSGAAARDIVAGAGTGRHVPVRFSLAGGLSLVGKLVIVMPAERSRVVDYLNASGRFLPLYGEGIVTLVQRRFIVTARSSEGAQRD